MTKPLGIIELLTRIGEDNIRLQNLIESATNFQSRKGGQTAVTFLTNAINPTQVFRNETNTICLVLWLPADLVEAAQAAHRSAEGRSSLSASPRSAETTLGRQEPPR